MQKNIAKKLRLAKNSQDTQFKRRYVYSQDASWFFVETISYFFLKLMGNSLAVQYHSALLLWYVLFCFVLPNSSCQRAISS